MTRRSLWGGAQRETAGGKLAVFYICLFFRAAGPYVRERHSGTSSGTSPVQTAPFIIAAAEACAPPHRKSTGRQTSPLVAAAAEDASQTPARFTSHGMSASDAASRNSPQRNAAVPAPPPSDAPTSAPESVYQHMPSDMASEAAAGKPSAVPQTSPPSPEPSTVAAGSASTDTPQPRNAFSAPPEPSNMPENIIMAPSR